MNNIIEKLGLKTSDDIVGFEDVWKIYKLAGMAKPHFVEKS